MGHHSRILEGGAILVPYGLAYFGVTWLLGVEECKTLFQRFQVLWNRRIRPSG
jgi:hypothetical protein